MANVTKSQAISIGKLVGELAEIASFRDINTAHLILTDVLSRLGVDASEVPQLADIAQHL